MNTAKELYKKWKGQQCVCDRLCLCNSINEYGLERALIEHNKEIIDLIDEMNCIASANRATVNAVLTELKNKIKINESRRS